MILFSPIFLTSYLILFLVTVAFFKFLEQDELIYVSGHFPLLFTLLETLFSQLSTWIASPSPFRSQPTFSESTYLIMLLKAASPFPKQSLSITSPVQLLPRQHLPLTEIILLICLLVYFVCILLHKLVCFWLQLIETPNSLIGNLLSHITTSPAIGKCPGKGK